MKHLKLWSILLLAAFLYRSAHDSTKHEVALMGLGMPAYKEGAHVLRVGAYAEPRQALTLCPHDRGGQG